MTFFAQTIPLRRCLAVALSPLVLGGILSGCASLQSGPAKGQGQLEVRANGEDFVRRGLVTKDDWAITFDHVYITLAELEALQTDPPFDPDGGTTPQVVHRETLPASQVVDLASPNASTALVTSFPEASAGRYNALLVAIAPAKTGPAIGESLRLVGQAEKAGRNISFTLDWDQAYRYACGDFIGDQRKGILKAGDRADLEVTFHFDHVFGNGEAPASDELNQTALGFEPLARLATSQDQIQLDRAALQAQLTPDDWKRLEAAMAGLVHTGEGHCQETQT